MKAELKGQAPVNAPEGIVQTPGLRSLNERVERLYALLRERMTWKQKSWGEGLTVLYGPADAQLPLVVRRAKAFEKTLREMPIAIEEDDLIVGNSVEDGLIVRTHMPRYATEEERAQAREENAYIEAGLAHKTPCYPDVLGKGLSGIIFEIRGKTAEVYSREQSEERDGKLALFEAMRLECEAVVALAHRYANLAERLSTSTASSKRREELLRIARVCRRVPEFPASTLHEAAQSFCFIHYALFSTGTYLSCGRLDQYLHPFLKRQLDDGSITLEEAQEVIDCLWLRFNDRAQVSRENFFPSDVKHDAGLWEAGHRKRPAVALEFADAVNHWGQNILLSGIRPDGADGTNELTYLCLNATEKLALTSPVVTVRLHKGSPRGLVFRTAEVLKKGGGMPFVNNDDVQIQGYVDLGIPLEDARDYANSNCWETMIQGKSDQELIRGINFLLYLELALNRGVSRIDGGKYGLQGLDTGDPRRFTSFRKLMDAWKAQTDHQLKQAIDHIGRGIENGTLEHSGHGRYCLNPLLSALTLDCLVKEKDVTQGGARYVMWHVMGEALADAINSMAAVKKTVFDEESVTMDELLSALEADWEGYENLRRRLVSRAPKFANDDDYADSIGREMMDHFVERARLHAARHPAVIFPLSVGTFSWVLTVGREVGATPDGRHSGEPVAVNLSPAPGTDVSGPTAAIRSYLKMRVGSLAAGAPIDLRFSRNSVEGEEGTQRLAGFIEAFIHLGGNMVTLTVTDVEDLRRAMEEPNKYRHLRVRMGGWSAYFIMLSEEQQRLHIQRVEHGLA